jgi:hypothetical protein
MRSDETIKAEILEVAAKAHQTREWDIREREELEAELHRLEVELRDPAALLSDRDLRDVDDLIK